MSDEALLADFLRNLEVARAVSPHTRRAYEGDVSALATYLAGQGLSLTQATHLHLRGYLGVASVSLSPASRARPGCRCRRARLSSPTTFRAGRCSRRR